MVLGQPCLSSIREVPVAGETGLLVLVTCSYPLILTNYYLFISYYHYLYLKREDRQGY